VDRGGGRGGQRYAARGEPQSSQPATSPWTARGTPSYCPVLFVLTHERSPVLQEPYSWKFVRAEESGAV